MLVPGGHRIVLEVDGKHHYATGTQADPAVRPGTQTRPLRRLPVRRRRAQRRADPRPMLQAFVGDLFRTYQVR
jgi:hypothetical protein